MPRSADSIRSEARQLPLMLGKLIGGLAAVLGTLVAVLSVTRPTDPATGNVSAPLLIAAAGVAVFVVCHRALLGRQRTADLHPPERRRIDQLSWGLLALFALAFLGAVLLLSR